MPLPPHISRNSLQTLIDNAEGARAGKGHALFLDGAVTEKSITRHTGSFIVRGGQWYTVKLHWTEARVEPECSCPDSENAYVCKHIVAAAFFLLDREGFGEQAASSPVRAAIAPAPAPVSLNLAALPKVTSDDPESDRWLGALLTVRGPAQSTVAWQMTLGNPGFEFSAFPSTADRAANQNAYWLRSLKKTAPLDPVLNALEEQWNDHPPFKPTHRMLDVLAHGRIDLTWRDNNAPVQWGAEPLTLRINVEAQGDKVRFSGNLLDHGKLRDGPAPAAWIGPRLLLRIGDTLRMAEPAPPELLRLATRPHEVSLASFAAKRAQLERVLQPYLAGPLEVPELNEIAPVRIEAVVSVFETTHGRIEQRRFVRYVFPEGVHELPAQKQPWSRPQVVVARVAGKLLRFARDPQPENQLRALRADAGIHHNSYVNVVLAELRDECAHVGVLLETNGLEEQYREVELSWVANLRLREEKDERLLSLYLEAGGVPLNAAEILAAWRDGARTIRLDPKGPLVKIPLDVMDLLSEWRQTRSHTSGEVPLSLREAFEALELHGSRLQLDAKASALLDRIRGFAGMPPGKPSRRFKTELRPYQARGLSWLLFLREFNLGGILADDMGLGKTVQSLAYLDLIHEPKKKAPPSIILAPASVALNWREECARFVPHLRVANPQTKVEVAKVVAAGGFDLLLLSYSLGTLAREHILPLRYSVALFDEAQALKNKLAERNKLARALQAGTKVALTGTPIENHVGEFKALFDCVQEGFLGDGQFFEQYFRYPIERHGDQERLSRLRRQTAPLVLRRTKELVARELPPKSEVIEWVELGDAQRKLYDGLLGAYRKSIRERVAKQGFAKSKLHVLEVLLRLRQAACAPGLLPAELRKKVSDAAKLEALDGLLEDALAGGHKVLLFSQFVELLTLVKARLPKGLRYAYLDGATKDRMAEIKRFQGDPDCKLFLLSLHAGGRGINLTAADYVIFLDPWWNPAVEDQARDRAHRIGQEKQVFVYRLAAKNTVEEVILKLQEKKRSLFQALLDGNDAPLAESLSAQDVAELFGMPLEELRGRA